MKYQCLIIAFVFTLIRCSKDDDSINLSYECKKHTIEYGPCSPNPINTIVVDTLLVTKSANGELSLPSTTFKLDSNLSFSGFYYQSHHHFEVRFNHSQDSIYVFIEDGGLGCGIDYEYLGHKF